MPLSDQVGELLLLQQEGKIRHIGLSEVTVPQIEEVRTIADIVSVQNLYTLANRSAEEMLDYAERENLGFIGGGSGRLVGALAVWGTDDAIRARLAEFHAVRANHLALQIITGEGGETPPHAQWRHLADIVGLGAKNAYPQT